jgi:hypothetical protein
LTRFLEDCGILLENQAGFRKGYSCSDHTFTLHLLTDLFKKVKVKENFSMPLWIFQAFG